MKEKRLTKPCKSGSDMLATCRYYEVDENTYKEYDPVKFFESIYSKLAEYEDLGSIEYFFELVKRNQILKRALDLACSQINEDEDMIIEEIKINCKPVYVSSDLYIERAITELNKQTERKNMSNIDLLTKEFKEQQIQVDSAKFDKLTSWFLKHHLKGSI